MFYEFCHHCGSSINQQQVVGKMLVCSACKQEIGVPSGPPQKVMIDKNEELIKQGVAARCPLCQQVVETKGTGKKTYVPHYSKGDKPRICPNSGKPA